MTRHNRGFTLVELLVTIAIGSLAIGMAYTIWSATENSASDLRTRLAMRQHALGVAQRVDRALRFRVPPEDVLTTATQNSATTATAEQFLSDRITLVSTAFTSSTTSARLTLESHPDMNGVPDVVDMTEGEVASDAPGKKTRIGTQADLFRTSLNFMYATADPDGKISWVDTITTAAPTLVKMTIRTWPRNEKKPTFDEAINADGRALRHEYSATVRMQ